MQEAHCIVETASDGNEGLRKTREFDPDIVLLDIMMPGMDGIEVCHAFKRIWGPSRPKILILSGIGAGARMDVNKLLKETLADGFMDKPYKSEALVGRIKALLFVVAPPSH